MVAICASCQWRYPSVMGHMVWVDVELSKVHRYPWTAQSGLPQQVGSSVRTLRIWLCQILQVVRRIHDSLNLHSPSRVSKQGGQTHQLQMADVGLLLGLQVESHRYTEDTWLDLGRSWLPPVPQSAGGLGHYAITMRSACHWSLLTWSILRVVAYTASSSSFLEYTNGSARAEALIQGRKRSKKDFEHCSCCQDMLPEISRVPHSSQPQSQALPQIARSCEWPGTLCAVPERRH